VIHLLQLLKGECSKIIYELNEDLVDTNIEEDEEATEKSEFEKIDQIYPYHKNIEKLKISPYESLVIASHF
jgi:hypothetical protein